MLERGEVAPRFSLPDADMEIFDLDSVLGTHNVVLYFYARDKAPICIRLAADFSDNEDEFIRCGCVVIGISPDDCLTHAEFRDREGLSIRLLSDTETEVSQLYGVWVEKEVDGLKRMGMRRSTFIIDRQGRIAHALYDIAPRGHVAEVLELVRKLDTDDAEADRKK